MQLELRIRNVGKAIKQIVRNLETLGYQFAEPTEVLPGPESETEIAIERIEREIGDLPASIKIFWRSIGSVNLTGFHPDWRVDIYEDPLVVFPPSIAIYELDAFLDDRDERLRHNFPYLVPIAPDYYHKGGDSGGMWYNLSVPAASDDPLLNDEPHRMTFVDYLEYAVTFGGFPGLDGYPHHNWPIERIVADGERSS